MRSVLPFGFLVICLWVGGSVLSAGAQITKANADRLAVAMCEVTQDCR